MRKILCMLLSVILVCLAFSGCGADVTDNGTDSEGAQGELTDIVKIAALNGPTGMGVVKLMDMADKYQVTTYQAPTDIVPKLISGEVDIACLPSNMGAMLYNKTDGEIVTISPMVMGVLYILGNGVSDVKSISDLRGKTIVSSGKGGTPEYVLQKIIENAGLTLGEDEGDIRVEWLASHADVNAKLLTEEGCIAMIPEPFVSTAITKSEENDMAIGELFDLNEEWSKVTSQELPMGVLVARRSFAEERTEALGVMMSDMEASIKEVNGLSEEICSLLMDKGFFGNATVAKRAIPNCRLCLYTGDKKEIGKEMMETFNETMYEINPDAIGGKLPREDMYY